MVCSVSKKCNSCQLANLDEAAQLRFKQNSCQRLIGPFCEVKEITSSPCFERYRNKAQFVFRKNGKGLSFGVFRSGVRASAETTDCLLCTERANGIARALCRLFQSFKVAPYDFHRGTGWLKSVTVREGFATGEVMVVISGADARFPAKKTFVSALLKACPAVTTVVLTKNPDPRKLTVGEVFDVLYGEGFITDVLCGKRFLLSPASFYQINPLQTERLYQKAIELSGVDRTMTVLDAYCGVGTIGICAADRAGEILAVEQNPQAVKDARQNARLNGVTNVRVVRADAKDYLRALKDEKKHIDAAFIDPPRAGCSASFLNTLAKLSPDRIVYISCNPETQARDIRILGRLGYRAEVCYPFDMFPQTNHVESVVLMSRA